MWRLLLRAKRGRIGLLACLILLGMSGCGHGAATRMRSIPALYTQANFINFPTRATAGKYMVTIAKEDVPGAPTVVSVTYGHKISGPALVTRMGDFYRFYITLTDPSPGGREIYFNSPYQPLRSLTFPSDHEPPCPDCAPKGCGTPFIVNFFDSNGYRLTPGFDQGVQMRAEKSYTALVGDACSVSEWDIDPGSIGFSSVTPQNGGYVFTVTTGSPPSSYETAGLLITRTACNQTGVFIIGVSDIY